MIDYTYKNDGTLGHFRFWCQKILPAVYDDSLSYYELLDKIVYKLNENIDAINIHSDSIEFIQNEIEQLRKELDEGYYREEYINIIKEWIDENIPAILGNAIRMVFFGLSLDGHFVAYIPRGNGWDDITFDTGAIYGSDEYGRLILRYYVSGEPLEVRQ